MDAFAKRIECPIAIIDKRRTGPNEAKALNLIGDVTGKTAIILDDMIDTAGTLVQAVDSLLKNGAKRVFAVATHPVLSGPAISRLSESGVRTPDGAFTVEDRIVRMRQLHPLYLRAQDVDLARLGVETLNRTATVVGDDDPPLRVHIDPVWLAAGVTDASQGAIR